MLHNYVTTLKLFDVIGFYGWQRWTWIELDVTWIILAKKCITILDLIEEVLKSAVVSVVNVSWEQCPIKLVWLKSHLSELQSVWHKHAKFPEKKKNKTTYKLKLVRNKSLIKLVYTAQVSSAYACSDWLLSLGIVVVLAFTRGSKFTFLLADSTSIGLAWSLVVCALDFWSGGRWFKPGLCCCVVSLDKKLYSTLSLFNQGQW